MIWDEYLADRKKDGKKIKAFEENWKALAPRFAHMLVTDITNDVCRSFAKERLERGRIVTRKGKDGEQEQVRYPVTVGTVWTELLRLRSCVNWAWEHNRLRSLGLDSKPKIWVPRKPKSTQTALTVDEFLALVQGCSITPHLRLLSFWRLPPQRAPRRSYSSNGRRSTSGRARSTSGNRKAWSIRSASRCARAAL